MALFGVGNQLALVSYQVVTLGFAELESKGANLGKKLWRFYGKVRRVGAAG
jgi:hypothetical protein